MSEFVRGHCRELYPPECMGRKKLPDNLPWVEADGPAVGAGGQGDVVLVEPKADSGFPAGRYALKRLRNVGSEQARARFTREVEALQRVEDTRVTKLVDARAEAAADFWYYVMPYHGDTHEALNRLVHADASPFLRNARCALNLIAECAEALVAVHKAGIVHRDIKPANVLVHLDTFAPILLDFGCCHVHDGDTITLVDEAVGTRNYMAPESESGSSEDVGPTADLYSLGKLLWVLVTGRQPFAREGPAFSGPTHIPNALPDDPDSWHVTHILERTVRADPANRFQTAAELALECRRLARTVVGRFPPLELVHKRCPACGQVEPSAGGAAYRDIKNSMHMVFGNHRIDGIRKVHCDACGYMYVFNGAVVAQRNKRLQELT